MIFRLLLVLCLLFPALESATANSVDPSVLHANSIAKDGIVYKEGYFGKGDNRLHYVEAGSGPLIVLYHGFPSFWYSWFDQMELLKQQYRVVAVDGLGAGLSAKPENADAYRVEKLAKQLDGLARHLNGGKRFTLVGHDWGAALAFAYAQGYPKRLNAVIGMSAPPYNLFLDLVKADKEQQARSQYMQIFRGLTLNDIRARNLTEIFWQQSYGKLIERGDLTGTEGALFRAALADPLALNGGMNWYRANMPEIDRIDAKTRWPRNDRQISVPSLLIWGTADTTFVPEFLTRMKTVAPDVEVVQIDGVNHWTSMERPEAANAAITAFLEKLPMNR